MDAGRVVLLNGPSSAGKSSLAAALVDLMPTPWFNLPVDLVHSIRSRPDHHGHDLSPGAWQEVFRKSRAGYHRMLGGMAAAGNDVVADHVLSEPWRLQDLLEVLEGVRVLLVHVTAPLGVLEQREQARGDREVGTARLQHEIVFAHGDCDLLVNTHELTCDESSARVARLVDDWPEDTAFDRPRR